MTVATRGPRRRVRSGVFLFAVTLAVALFTASFGCYAKGGHHAGGHHGGGSGWSHANALHRSSRPHPSNEEVSSRRTWTWYWAGGDSLFDEEICALFLLMVIVALVVRLRAWIICRMSALSAGTRIEEGRGNSKSHRPD